MHVPPDEFRIFPDEFRIFPDILLRNTKGYDTLYYRLL